MRNLIIGISVVFIAIIAVSYFYFSGLDGQVIVEEPSFVQDTGRDNMPVEEEVPEPASGDNNTLWTFGLNSGAITVPSVHRNSDSTRFILVQDAYHILHAISADGQKLWNAQLPGPIVDSISQLADLSLVFATAERLYRIDTEGDPLPGFSLKLPQRATGGVATTSHEEDGSDIRIEVMGSRQIMSYDGRGRLLSRQTRNSSDPIADDDFSTTDSTLNDLPNNCGPLAYVGPLYDDDRQYLLCSKGNGDLYCFSY